MGKISCVCLLIGITLLGITAYRTFYVYERDYGYAIKLADDASLPGQKAVFLREYRGRVSSINGPPRLILKRPDLNLEKQLKIIDGLILRFDDVAKMEPSSIAYQNGMEQLVGQETDHAMSRINGIFLAAWWRQSVFAFVLLCVISWIIFGGGIVLGFIHFLCV